MASGGHHGGSSHSGGHHSSGGFGGGGHSGGHFSSGGFSGGGYHSYGGGFDSGYHRGGRSNLPSYRNYDSEDDPYTPWVYFIFIGGELICFLGAQIVAGNIPGLNLINFIIFVVAACLFIPSLNQNERTSALVEIWRDMYSKSFIQSDSYTRERIGNKDTWAGKYDKSYLISFYNSQYGDSNAKSVYEAMKRTPRIIWIRPKTWALLAVGLFTLNFFFYETFIPYFETATMSDEAFAFFDEFIFYLPSVLALACPILSIIFVKIRDKVLYQCAYRICSNMDAEEERSATQTFIESQLSKKWYYKICPNCGAPASSALKSCTSCGSSLEVMDGDQHLSAMRRLNEGAGEDNSTAYLDRRIPEA